MTIERRKSHRRFALSVFLSLAGLTAFAGCSQNQPVNKGFPALATTRPESTEGLLPPQHFDELHVTSPLPVGWTQDPAKHTADHDHQGWLSPSKHTAYGVITFYNWLLPLASDQAVLDKFLETMKKGEGEARLLNLQKDPKLGGLRFIAEGGQYTVRGNLITHGTRGWVIYAGTLAKQPVVPEELDIAERAREHTVLGD